MATKKNAEKFITIKVLRKHIDKGESNHTQKCAFALAVKDHFKLTKRDEYSVDDTEIDVWIYRKGVEHHMTWKIPAAAKKWMDVFDCRKENLHDNLFFEDKKLTKAEKAKLKPISFKLQLFI